MLAKYFLVNSNVPKHCAFDGRPMIYTTASNKFLLFPSPPLVNHPYALHYDISTTRFKPKKLGLLGAFSRKISTKASQYSVVASEAIC